MNSNIIGQRITAMGKDEAGWKLVTLASGAKLVVLEVIKPSAGAKTLTQFLRSIGIDSFYIDKRKSGYRVKLMGGQSSKQFKQLAALVAKLKDVSLEKEKYWPMGRHCLVSRRLMKLRTRLIIRTKQRPSKIKI